MDWLDAVTAALAIVAVPLALRYPINKHVSRHDNASSPQSCDCLDNEQTHNNHKSDNDQPFPQEEEPTQSGNPDFPIRRGRQDDGTD